MTAMTANDMAPPAGVPALLKVGQVARVLNLGERRVRVWLDRGALEYVQPTGRSGGRLVPASALAAFAAGCGLRPDWAEALG